MNIEKFEEKVKLSIIKNNLYLYLPDADTSDEETNSSYFGIAYNSQYKNKSLTIWVYGDKPFNFYVYAENWDKLFKKTLKILKGYKE